MFKIQHQQHVPNKSKILRQVFLQEFHDTGFHHLKSENILKDSYLTVQWFLLIQLIVFGPNMSSIQNLVWFIKAKSCFPRFFGAALFDPLNAGKHLLRVGVHQASPSTKRAMGCTRESRKVYGYLSEHWLKCSEPVQQIVPQMFAQWFMAAPADRTKSPGPPALSCSAWGLTWWSSLQGLFDNMIFCY